MASLELIGAGLQSAQGTVLLSNLNARFHTGEFTVIAGPSASGKSNLIRILGGEENRFSGELRHDGRLLRSQTSFLAAKIAMVPQNPSARLIARSVADELTFGLPRNTRIEEILAWAELPTQASQHPHSLSFGEQRRLCIASALLTEPDFLILDDPFLGLDHVFIPRLIERLLTWHQTGHGIILVSNEFEKFLAHADRLMLLKQGRIIADALPERVLPFLDAHGFRKPNLKLAEMSWLKA